MHPRIPFLLALRASVRRFQMPLKGFNFVKTGVTFGIIREVKLDVYGNRQTAKIKLLPFVSSSRTIESNYLYLQ